MPPERQPLQVVSLECPPPQTPSLEHLPSHMQLGLQILWWTFARMRILLIQSIHIFFPDEFNNYFSNIFIQGRGGMGWASMLSSMPIVLTSSTTVPLSRRTTLTTSTMPSRLLRQSWASLVFLMLKVHWRRLKTGGVGGGSSEVMSLGFGGKDKRWGWLEREINFSFIVLHFLFWFFFHTHTELLMLQQNLYHVFYLPTATD